MTSTVTGTKIALASVILGLFTQAYAAAPLSKSEDGLNVTAEIDVNPGTTELANRLAKIQAENAQLRSQILQIQDAIASQQKNMTALRIEATVDNATQENSPIGYVELEASLNDFPLVRYVQAPMMDKNPSYPIFVGPIPAGSYSLRVRSVAGVLQHGWPYSLLQGRWNMDKTFPLKIESGKNLKIARIVLKRGDISPSLSLVETEASPP